MDLHPADPSVLFMKTRSLIFINEQGHIYQSQQFNGSYLEAQEEGSHWPIPATADWSKIEQLAKETEINDMDHFAVLLRTAETMYNYIHKQPMRVMQIPLYENLLITGTSPQAEKERQMIRLRRIISLLYECNLLVYFYTWCKNGFSTEYTTEYAEKELLAYTNVFSDKKWCKTIEKAEKQLKKLHHALIESIRNCLKHTSKYQEKDLNVSFFGILQYGIMKWTKEHRDYLPVCCVTENRVPLIQEFYSFMMSLAKNHLTGCIPSLSFHENPESKYCVAVKEFPDIRCFTSTKEDKETIKAILSQS